uniref:ATP synthase F0 subunit 8 n=1 Tax=Micrura bella TaxID=1692167 RepID=A0A0U2EZS5_9BILA|nr:ATP synthase F0 subunit 8 [Micrura bella]AKT74029.1 ATP synthase F0 subunit 8 [Micrura bella]
MPQLGPLSWLFLPFVVIFCLVLLYCSVWWASKSDFSFGENVLEKSKGGVSDFVWKW